MKSIAYISNGEYKNKEQKLRTPKQEKRHQKKIEGQGTS